MPLDTFCGRTAWFVSDLVGNPEDRFSHIEAHILNCLEQSSFGKVKPFLASQNIIFFKSKNGFEL